MAVYLYIANGGKKKYFSMHPKKTFDHPYSMFPFSEMKCRAGNSLIGFPSESLVFCPKISERAIRSKNGRFTHSLIFGERPERFTHNRSFPLSDLSESLMVAHFWWATWVIRSHRSFLVSHLSDSLTSLTKKEEMSNSLIFSIKNFKNRK